MLEDDGRGKLRLLGCLLDRIRIERIEKGDSGVWSEHCFSPLSYDKNLVSCYSFLLGVATEVGKHGFKSRLTDLEKFT